MYTKTWKEKKLTSYIVLLSYQPTSTGYLAKMGWLAGAGWLVTQKDNVGSQFFFFACFWIDQNVFFPETYNAPIISELGFSVWVRLNPWNMGQPLSFLRGRGPLKQTVYFTTKFEHFMEKVSTFCFDIVYILQINFIYLTDKYSAFHENS